MTWSVTASGHCDTEEAERQVIAGFQLALTGALAYGSASGTANTQFHGTVQLHPVADEESTS